MRFQHTWGTVRSLNALISSWVSDEICRQISTSCNFVRSVAFNAAFRSFQLLVGGAPAIIFSSNCSHDTQVELIQLVVSLRLTQAAEDANTHGFLSTLKIAGDKKDASEYPRRYRRGCRTLPYLRHEFVYERSRFWSQPQRLYLHSLYISGY